MNKVLPSILIGVLLTLVVIPSSVAAKEIMKGEGTTHNRIHPETWCEVCGDRLCSELPFNTKCIEPGGIFIEALATTDMSITDLAITEINLTEIIPPIELPEICTITADECEEKFDLVKEQIEDLDEKVDKLFGSDTSGGEDLTGDGKYDTWDVAVEVMIDAGIEISMEQALVAVPVMLFHVRRFNTTIAK